MATSSGGKRVTVLFANVPLSVTDDRIAEFISERGGEVERTWRLQRNDDKVLVQIIFSAEGMVKATCARFMIRVQRVQADDTDLYILLCSV